MPDTQSRREFLRTAALLLPAAALPRLAAAKFPTWRRLRFAHTHTHEKLDIVYCESGRYLPDALAAVDRLLRDFRTREIHPIDPALLDTLYELQELTGSSMPYQIISGYRSPATNDQLRKRTSGVARDSLHMQGRAIDLRLADVRTNTLRDAAIELGQGGVGYYPSSDFVHLDSGRVRAW